METTAAVVGSADRRERPATSTIGEIAGRILTEPSCPGIARVAAGADMRQWRKYLGKVFARRILCQRGPYRERTDRPRRTGNKWIELVAGTARRVCNVKRLDMRGSRA